MRVLVLLSFLLLVGACASRPQYDRVQEKVVYAPIPADLTDCPEPLWLTDEQIDAMKTETELVEQWLLPQAERHEVCWRNSQRLKTWQKE